MHCLGTSRPARFCLHRQSAGPAGPSTAAALRPCRSSSRRQNLKHRHLAAAAAAAGDGEKSPEEASLQLSPEEAAVYEALAAEKKAARQQTLQDAKRKRKFNPLHTKMKLTAAEPEDFDEDSTPPPPPAAAAAAAAAPAAVTSSSSSSSSVGTIGGARFAARPRALPTGLKAALQQQQQQQVASAASATTAERPQHAPAAAAVKPAQPPSAALTAAVGALGLEGGLAAELSQLLAAEDIPEVEALNPDEFEQAPQGFGASARRPQPQARGRKTPGEIAKAAAARRAQRQRVQEKALQANARALVQQAEGELDDEFEFEDVTDDDTGDNATGVLSQQQPGGQPAATAAAAADPDDDLDWQALAQYEELETYLAEVQKEQQQQQRGLGRKPAAPAASKVQVPAALSAAAAAVEAAEEQSATLPEPATAATASAATAAAAAPAAAAISAAAPAAAPKQAFDAAAAPSTQQPASTKASAQPPQPPQPPPQQQQKQKPIKKGKKARAKQVAKFENDLDDLEELVTLFEAMQPSSSSKQLAPKPSLPDGSSSGSSTGATAAAADTAGEVLLASLLGKDWEAELLDDLAAVIDEGEEGDQQQQQQGKNTLAAAAAAAAADDADEDEQPWMDDITALLLGLVSISHQKYLNQPLPLLGLEAVTEEQRCGAFWEAPWGLLVLDDSAQNCVEYVNEAASKALGVGYLDLFGQSAVQLVDQSLEAQADWAFAVRQVEESVSFSCTLPELQLVDASGRQVIARDVTLWRVDSLEDTPIGFALMFKSWRYL